jgi:hypothetical protein
VNAPLSATTEAVCRAAQPNELSTLGMAAKGYTWWVYWRLNLYWRLDDPSCPDLKRRIVGGIGILPNASSDAAAASIGPSESAGSTFAFTIPVRVDRQVSEP